MRFFHPVPGGIGDPFGAPREGGRKHSGVDFPVAYGTLIEAAGVGTMVFAGYNSGGYGNLVVSSTGSATPPGTRTCRASRPGPGEPSQGGTRIGYVGSTGHSTGPHLHFEVRINNIPVNPVPYLLAGTAAKLERRWCEGQELRRPERLPQRSHRRLPVGARLA